MAFLLEEKENCLALSVDYLLNEAENRNILSDLEEYFEDGQANVIVDLQELPYLNSTGMSFLIAVLTRSRNAGGDTVVTGINDKVDKLLVMTKLREMLPVYTSVEEAQTFFAN